MIRVILRCIGFVLVCALFLLLEALARAFIWDPKRLRAYQIQNTSGCASLLLSVLGIEVSWQGEEPSSPCLWVANHHSTFDILILAAKRPLVFLTSIEVRDQGLLGLLCRAGGASFVERRSKSDLARKELPELEALVRSGFELAIFPEGTTTDRPEGRPFRSSLFALCERASIEVQPIALHYPAEILRQISYIDDDTFISHLLRCMQIPRIQVGAELLACIPPASRKELSARAERSIRTALRVPVNFTLDQGHFGAEHPLETL
jgi:1-acyl-sn-glycerol-3-phosphate acyltransferase